MTKEKEEKIPNSLQKGHKKEETIEKIFKRIFLIKFIKGTLKIKNRKKSPRIGVCQNSHIQISRTSWHQKKKFINRIIIFQAKD
jgi:hypothetical protein